MPRWLLTCRAFTRSGERFDARYDIIDYTPSTASYVTSTVADVVVTMSSMSMLRYDDYADSAMIRQPRLTDARTSVNRMAMFDVIVVTR